MNGLWNDVAHLTVLPLISSGSTEENQETHVRRVRIPETSDKSAASGVAALPWRLFFRAEQQSEFGGPVVQPCAGSSFQLYPHHPVHALLTFLP
jgi:hypothetical protein